MTADDARLRRLAIVVLLGAIMTVLDSTIVTVAVTAGVVLLLVGAVTKSALVPFHFWLPAAMAAPTPVSAYLHAAAMVKAGVYLVARFAPAYADLAVWQGSVLVLGAVTMLLGAWRALRQCDLKLLLAYGTVSQLGFLVVLVGTGTTPVRLGEVKAFGKKQMAAADWARGVRLESGVRLGG